MRSNRRSFFHLYLESLVTTMKSEPVIIDQTINAPIVIVWKTITDKEEMKHWYFTLHEFNPEVGFEFEFWGGKEEGEKKLHLCKVIEVIPERKLTHSWKYNGYEGNSYVTFELSETGSQTRLKLTHEGIDTFPNHPDFAKENFIQGWTFIIKESLRKFLENK